MIKVIKILLEYIYSTAVKNYNVHVFTSVHNYNNDDTYSSNKAVLSHKMHKGKTNILYKFSNIPI